MNESRFKEELKRIARDMALEYDGGAPQGGRWGIYQIKTSLQLLPGMQTKPWLLWYCEDDDGNFRMPDQRDLGKAIRSRQMAEVAWNKPLGYVADLAEKNQTEAEAPMNKRNDDKAEWAAKEIVKAARRQKTFKVGN